MARERLTLNGVEHFRCRGECGRLLPREAFGLLSNPRSACGIRSECRKCEYRRRAKHKAGVASGQIRVSRREKRAEYEPLGLMPIRDISARLGISKSRVDQLLKRALRKLRRAMAGMEELIA